MGLEYKSERGPSTLFSLLNSLPGSVTAVAFRKNYNYLLEFAILLHTPVNDGPSIH